MTPLRRQLRTPQSAAAILILALCLAYAGDAGHGFIKDDFRWIRETRIDAVSDVPRLLGRTDGFYRPLVSLSFSVSSAAGGLTPRQYGLTNLALLVAAAALVWRLARTLGLAEGPALVAAGAWAFNFHGINMAVLWISGRTALIVTIGALLTAIASVSGRTWLAGACCLLAMLSKEEAVLLPILVAAWCAYDAEGPATRRLATAARRAWPCFAAMAIYLALRLRTDAFWPADAPAYYRLSAAPSLLAGNLVQYADRALTWPLVVALVMYAASAGKARFDGHARRVVVFGALWIACMFALTVFVPVRSSLYAVLPSAGSALAAGAVASAASRAAPARAGMAMTALALLPLLLLPIYWLRNERWTRLADLSSTVLNQVRAAAEREPGRRIVIVDNPAERFNLDAAFGSLWPDASALLLPPGTVADLATDATSAPADAVVLRLEGGRLTQER
ncbi:MAG: hypothetical protein ACRD26_14575 [Vicinamibacterales bacterium]